MFLLWILLLHYTVIGIKRNFSISLCVFSSIAFALCVKLSTKTLVFFNIPSRKVAVVVP